MRVVSFSSLRFRKIWVIWEEVGFVIARRGIYGGVLGMVDFGDNFEIFMLERRELM